MTDKTLLQEARDALKELIDELKAIEIAMEHMGEVINGHDMATEEDEAKTTPGFEALHRLLTEAEERKGVRGVTEDDVTLMLQRGIALSTKMEDEAQARRFTRVQLEALLRRTALPSPTPDRKASVLALAEKLAVADLQRDRLPLSGILQLAEGVTQVSLAIHDAVDRAFEGRK